MNKTSKAPVTDLAKHISTEYNGKPTLMLNPGQRFVFQFQIARAKMILENLSLIRQFVETYDK